MNQMIVDKKIDGRPIDILLVEDNDVDVKITQLAFEESKVKNSIYVTRDGEDALNYIYKRGEYEESKKEAPTPDLILLDLNMPKIGGLEVLKALKADEFYKSIPVIILTSSASEEDIAKSYRDGATNYIQKPIDFEGFVDIVEGFNYYWLNISKLPHHR